MDRVYEAVVSWADVILVATPIRWGAASSLYFKMAERMNCIQNQITLADRVLMQNKVAGFIVTGGQDNIQAVVGQMLTFFGELGCSALHDDHRLELRDATGDACALDDAARRRRRLCRPRASPRRRR
jgi:multimeric flavodoxin WrbA